MLPGTFREEQELFDAPHYLPSVSVILPFEPKMCARTELEYRLKRVIEKVIIDESFEIRDLVIKMN